ncbi:MAG TPA: hypothetical protein VJ813_10215 [Vicinamibacterales bacterium]|nr:hypothetical protein [Vicinamibacterales bacterium]
MAIHAITPTDVPALARLQQRALIIGLIGIAAGLFGAITNRDQFFASWLIGFLFCLGLALGSLGLLMLQHLSGGQWGMVGRRVFEAASRTMPLLVLFFVPILFAMPTLFKWARPEVVAADRILQAKAPYLNIPFFTGRAVVYFLFWMVCVWLLTKWSAAQDRGEESTDPAGMVRFRTLSAPGLLVLVLTINFSMTDWVMSLDPHWYSTIYGLMFVSGFGLAALALVVAVLAAVGPVGALEGRLTPRHFHDLGKLMLAFTMLWAYLNFSQFLIIWSGNLPEEIPWYIERMRGGWGVVALALVLGHFALPFLLLLSQDLKKKRRSLARVAVFILVMRLVDTIWLVGPTFEHHGFPVHWMDVAVPAGLVGIWLFVFTRNLHSRALMPLNDPFLKEAFAHDAH